MTSNLLAKIIKTKNSIRRKYRAIKLGRAQTETNLEEMFKPITTPLRELVMNAKLEPKDQIKIEPKTEKNNDENNEGMDMVLKPKYFKMEQTSTPLKYQEHLSISEDEFATPTRSKTLMDESNSTLNTSNLISAYLKLYSVKNSRIDNTYGVYYDNNVWKIGNSTLEFDDENITIKGKVYKITLGLCELLFMKDPVRSFYTEEDLVNYQTILYDTSAYKRGYDDEGQIKGNKGKKYKKIISKLIPRTGMGLMHIPRTNIEYEYIYWDDPNELVDRLSLLIASQQAGNNNHNNEIVSIIEELKEADIIL